MKYIDPTMTIADSDALFRRYGLITGDGKNVNIEELYRACENNFQQ
jgi:hypothetical protein